MMIFYSLSDFSVDVTKWNYMFSCFITTFVLECCWLICGIVHKWRYFGLSWGQLQQMNYMLLLSCSEYCLQLSIDIRCRVFLNCLWVLECNLKPHWFNIFLRKLIHAVYNFCRYYLSLAYVASLFPGMLTVKAVSFFDVCSTAVLRSTNGVLAVLCSIILYEIITYLRPALDDRKATLQAVVLALYPLHWFFSFLYYTDVASLTAVLAMYLACLKKKYLFSALVRFNSTI